MLLQYCVLRCRLSSLASVMSCLRDSDEASRGIGIDYDYFQVQFI